MIVTLDTNAPLTEVDRAVLALLTGSDLRPGASAPVVAEPEPAAPKKAAAKKAIVVPPEPEVDVISGPPADEDVIAAASAPTISDAVSAATQLVSEGNKAKVVAALEAVGAKRVTEMKVEDVPAFLKALEA